jgi:hypothetical protein
MHCNLFKFVILNPQELVIYREKRNMELPCLPIEPLSDAINELQWPAYCKAQEEKEQKEIQALIDQEQARIQSLIDKSEREAAEKHTNMLKAILGNYNHV